MTSPAVDDIVIQDRKITVFEGDDPLITVTVYTRATDGTRALLNLTGYTADCWIKGAYTITDSDSSTVHYTGTVLTQAGATLGQFTVQMIRTDLATSEDRVYRMAVTNSLSKRQTVRRGPFEVGPT